MEIYGFQSLTLLDYPGCLAATIFTGGCNFRCPFCQNKDLLHPEEPIPGEEIFAVLKKRRRMLDGVCVTGGEPTLQPDLAEFLAEVRSLGYRIKLDTNGSRPEVLRQLAEKGLLDYVAMDIKNSPAKYAATCGRLPSFDAVKESVDFLMRGSLDYEFRTTVMPELHTETEMREIGAWIAGAPRYFLQAYRESDGVLSPVFTEPGKEYMEQMRQAVLPYVPQTQIRGLDVS